MESTKVSDPPKRPSLPSSKFKYLSKAKKYSFDKIMHLHIK